MDRARSRAAWVAPMAAMISALGRRFVLVAWMGQVFQAGGGNPLGIRPRGSGFVAVDAGQCDGDDVGADSPLAVAGHGEQGEQPLHRCLAAEDALGCGCGVGRPDRFAFQDRAERGPRFLVVLPASGQRPGRPVREGTAGQGFQERVLHGGSVVDPCQRVKLAVHVGMRVGAQRVLDGLRDGRVTRVGCGKRGVPEEEHVVRVGADDVADEAEDSRVLGTAQQERGPGEAPVAEGVAVVLVQDLKAVVACLLPGERDRRGGRWPGHGRSPGATCWRSRRGSEAG